MERLILAGMAAIGTTCVTWWWWLSRRENGSGDETPTPNTSSPVRVETSVSPVPPTSPIIVNQSSPKESTPRENKSQSLSIAPTIPPLKASFEPQIRVPNDPKVVDVNGLSPIVLDSPKVEPLQEKSSTNVGDTSTVSSAAVVEKENELEKTKEKEKEKSGRLVSQDLCYCRSDCKKEPNETERKFDGLLRYELTSDRLEPIQYETPKPMDIWSPISDRVTSLSAEARGGGEKARIDHWDSFLTPFEPILHAIEYADRHAALIETLINNYDYLES